MEKQVQAEHQAIVGEVRGNCQKERELRQLVDELKRF